MSEPRVYEGRVYVRPVGRGIVLLDTHTDLDDWMAGALSAEVWTGGGAYRQARITVERLPDQEGDGRE